MEAVFSMNADELGMKLVEHIRSVFAHERIRISVVNEGAEAGVKVRDLPALFESLPHLSSSNSQTFAKDVEEIRRMANAIPPRDPWAS